MEKLYFGCIADDFTGASDVASFLAETGINTLLVNGVPEKYIDISSYEAIVIALKTRTIPKEDAVKDSHKGMEFLKEVGARQIYIKYCSTFDSTKEGNIGPIVDDAIDYLNCKYTILEPALPVNGRQVIDGHLYVNGLKLHESSMKNHPLTPMLDSDITKLMETQSRYKSFVFNEEKLMGTYDEIIKEISILSNTYDHFYIVPDFSKDEHGKRIIELFGNLPLLTGGSGLMTAIGNRILQRKDYAESSNGLPEESYSLETAGRGLVIAGSCSDATLRQIEVFKDKYPDASYKIDPLRVISGEEKIEDLVDFIENHSSKDLLIYSSDTKENVKIAQNFGSLNISEKLENLVAMASKKALAMGYKRIIVAGGETSGAVAKKLGFDAYKTMESVSPGVPILIPLKDKAVRIVFKSGNFGDEEFFIRGLEMTKEPKA
jgi:uncharacterized protein YgbK (DUF1537 family)